MSELKRCPCCNKEVEIAKDELFGLYAIECKNCRILMYDRCKEDLIKKWNTRKPMERILERLEAQAAFENVWDDDLSCGAYHAYSHAIEIVQEEGV